jgi:hypothetical protein
MQRMSVVLPQPLGPIRPVTVPAATSSDGMRTTSRPARRNGEVADRHGDRHEVIVH